jgi:bifunctional DNA-binding transcriptional regulator/antitoxin component of YhaV-PrlF toxin-antitoxin module
MNEIIIKASQSGDIVIPAEIVQRIGIKKDEDAELRMMGDALILHKRPKDLDVNEVLNILVAEGNIELAEVTFNEEEPENVPTLEELHRILADVSVPIEEIIREEREKRDDIFRS